MKKIYKFQFDFNTEMTIPYAYVNVIKVDNEFPDQFPAIWAEVELPVSIESDGHTYQVWSTGATVPDDNYKHVGTSVVADRGLVWHVYEYVG